VLGTIVSRGLVELPPAMASVINAQIVGKQSNFEIPSKIEEKHNKKNKMTKINRWRSSPLALYQSLVCN
jgi:hypothetical protein